MVLNEHQAFHRKAHFYQGYGLEQFLEGTSQQWPWPLIRNKASYHTSSLKEDGSSKTFLLGVLACPDTAPRCVPYISGDNDRLVFGEATHTEGCKRADPRTYCLPLNPSSVIN